MELNKSILLQKQVRDNSEDLQSEFLDLKNWEEQMKKADAEIRNERIEQTLPPVRRKKKASKESSKPQLKENNAKPKRIKSSDYSAWDKFDVNKACEELDKNDTDDEGEEPLSKEELEKNHAEATEHKITGNNFVKKSQWVNAAACYSTAIKIFPYDAVFFANRALCHLKMDNLHMAEADCTAAIELDEFYVKAYHRRATARISLKQYDEAAQDIKKMLELEPSNKEAKTMLARVNKSIGNSKPLIMSSTRTEIKESESKKEEVSSKTVNDQETKRPDVKEMTRKEIDGEVAGNKFERIGKTGNEVKIETSLTFPKWLPEIPENIEIVKAITKPPHQRSKKPLRTVLIEEIEFGPSRIVQDELNEQPKNSTSDTKKKENPSCRLSEPECTEISVPEAPKTAVQFLLTWRKNKSTEFRYKYLKKIAVERIPMIFQDSMESNTFSEILQVLRLEFIKQNDPVLDYLKYLSQVKRFRTLTMFMQKTDKEDVRALLDYSKILEDPPDDIIKDLLDRYEI
ncbi:RNA polymerase II-associated protein 3 [Venturia canescens]|uniref:RNA polymerase II-associated protein 3 n=1 Tax=Venturia canescens TaxID=32260 RepID=UPI001C9D1085|nr:RNA polymerase II-associated protein 3 [Venturia canescens]